MGVRSITHSSCRAGSVHSTRSDLLRSKPPRDAPLNLEIQAMGEARVSFASQTSWRRTDRSDGTGSHGVRRPSDLFNVKGKHRPALGRSCRVSARVFLRIAQFDRVEANLCFCEVLKAVGPRG
ncbi:hypothetical protein Nepgr_027989 [Nepenthes gracilis]|uniref:Uncharacterized protein n=1 Tax=Nepenthes gracilis TaxID=150966 RepID=A0AAD3Y447_NEPGR|nr:hypothetical protein Nepgr_027989 [Nepenthes gracilis]